MNAPAQGAILFGGKMGRAKVVWQITGIVSAILLLVFGAFFVSAQIFTLSSATESSSQVNVNISNPSDSTISALGYFIRLVSENNVNIELNPSRDGAVAYGVDNVYAWTNSPSGYKLYLSTTEEAAGSQRLYLDRDAESEHYFKPTGAADLDENSWGYGLTDAAFAAVPTRGNEALIRTTDEANQYAEMDDPLTKTPVYYGAKANLEIPSGDYYGTVLYSALADASAEADGEAMITPTSTMNLAGGESVTITTSLYTNIEDLGEVSVYIGENGNASDVCANPSTSTEGGVLEVRCAAPAHGVGEFDVFVNVPKFGKVYRIAEGIEYIGQFFTISTMQEMTSDICASATTPSASATQADTTGAYAGNKAYVPQRSLRDIRDGKSYRIRKLADGNCWMTENLDLALTQGLVLNSSNTDISGTWTIAAGEVTVSTTGAKWGTGTAWNDTTQITDTELETVHSYNGNGSAGSRTIATNKGNATPAIDGSDLVSPEEIQNIGTYYNWYAATAKSGTASITTNGAKASDSICPKGWKLPDSDGSKSFKNLLFTTYGLSNNDVASNGKIRSYPLSFVYSGYYYWVNGTVVDQGMHGDWWSSTTLSRANAYHLNIGYGPWSIPQSSSARAYGFSIRCVVK